MIFPGLSVHIVPKGIGTMSLGRTGETPSMCPLICLYCFHWWYQSAYYSNRSG